MGGTLPICPFCKKECATSGVKDHIKAKHPDKYVMWLNHGQLSYWQYDNSGELR